MQSPWGSGAKRAMYPENLGGPFGSPGNPIPMYEFGNNYAPSGPLPYLGEGVYMKSSPGIVEYGKKACSFGTLRLTPGGVTTEDSWGFDNKIKYGKSSIKKRRRSLNKGKRRGYKVKKSRRKRVSTKVNRKRRKSKKKSLCRPKFGRRSYVRR